MVEIDIELDTSDYDVKMQYLQKQTMVLAPELLLDIGLILAEEEKRIVPVKTGTLQDSIRFTPFGDEEGEVATSSGYGLFVDLPTKPHEIKARRANYLRIPLPDGKIIFRKRVFHTGTKGAFFRKATLENSAPRIKESVDDKLIELMGSWQ